MAGRYDKEWERADAEDKGIVADPLIEFLAPEPTRVPDYFVVVGLLGRAPEDHVWRIYLAYDLSEFYEVHERHIVYATTSGDERTRVWIENGSPMRYVLQRPTRAERFGDLRGGQGRPRAYRDDGGRYIQGPLADWGDEFGRDDDDGGPVGGTGCSCRPGSPP